jgi:hypothetical protein
MSDSKDLVTEGMPELPDWLRKMVSGMKSLREIDQLDDLIMTMPAERLKELHGRLDMDLFKRFMEWHVASNPSSPVRLTSLLRINGRPFTLSKHPFFEPMFYPDLPDSLLLVCARQVGKALSVDTPVPTPSGRCRIRDLKSGDFVLGIHGTPVKVLAVSPTLPAPVSFKVSFNDGHSVLACEDHLWTVHHPVGGRQGRRTMKIRRQETLTTRQLLDRGVMMKQEYRFALPEVKPVEFPEADLPIDPYVLGVWLGDGHSSCGRISSHMDDPAVVDEVSSVYPVYTVGRCRGSKGIYFNVLGLKSRLRGLGLLNDKRIPIEYLRASVSQRLALLQGLMDTDGTVTPRGLCSLGFSNQRLADDAFELLCSLGLVVKRSTKQPKYPGSKLHHRMNFTARRDELPVFRLPRKLMRMRTAAEAKGKPTQTRCKKIVSIEPAGPVPMCCIEVDSPDGLYLCGDSWIPTHNSTHLAAQGVLQAGALPRFKILFMAPQFEQIRRFSHQYIRQFVHESYIKDELMDRGSVDSVMQKGFRNGSELWFSFAKMSVDRVRGLSVDAIRIDEVQDMNPEFLDIVRECMSASERRSEMYSGTSKTVDNTIEQLRLRSSQAEWFMRCESCSHWNIPTVEGSGQGLGVMEMIRPEGMSCAKCRALLSPERGQWVHRYVERAKTFPSYHIPQVICPVHYANPKNWRSLLAKRDRTSTATFVNEVLGEACDAGQRLVSLTELKQACVLGPNTPDSASLADRYVDRVLGVDWGGKGTNFQSFTAAAVACYSPGQDRIDVLFGKVFQALMDPVIETKEVIDLSSKYSCTLIAHDVAVAGEVRRSIMRSMGVHDGRLANCRYAASGSIKAILQHVPSTDINPTEYYNLDKSQVVSAVCLAIKNGSIRFPQYETMKDDSGNNMLEHFLAVYEESSESMFGSEKRFIRRNPGMPDDFLHAVAFAVIVLWRRYPELVPDLMDAVLDGDELASFGDPRAYYMPGDMD